MRILIVNDDGIYSPGILALAQVAKEYGDVTIVAPDVERSSMGHAVTHSRPLSYRKTAIQGFEAFRVDGTPADCVAIGFSVAGKADVVLSGINIGLNLGNSMWHSGTLAGAKQAALMGSRGIALSAPTPVAEPNFEGLKSHVREVLSTLLPAQELTLVNVNFPAEPKGTLWTRQSVRHYDGKVVPSKDPMGRTHYWFTVFPVEETEEGTDRWALDRSFVSMTPLRLDLTDHEALKLQLKTNPATHHTPSQKV
ncbi:MAG: 5'/3'-nucleotidase SurE [Myxococcota bacterium]|jgi:5'-nucleotidase|nr:5'/3'-nucleotidase SurE [Myxococcota bacterium]